MDLYYISPCLCVCLFVRVFFSATVEPFALNFGMVFQNSAGKIFKSIFGSDGYIFSEYFPNASLASDAKFIGSNKMGDERGKVTDDRRQMLNNQ